MKVLIAEDDRPSRLILEGMLKKWGYDVISTSNGEEAWQIMQGDDPPPLCIIDWMMPEMNGMEFCRKVRESSTLAFAYIILLTGKRQREDVIAGIEAGANDYIRKPFYREELKARIHIGERVIHLQDELIKQVDELKALSRVKNLHAFMCQLQSHVFKPSEGEKNKEISTVQKKTDESPVKAAG